MEALIIISLFVLATGACIGSFLNVVALRALSKESIVFPASKCPVCNTPIKWYDNIPVLSYLFTFKGKCRSCGCKVSIQYPIVEVVTAILFLITFLAFGFTLKTLLLLILISIAIVIAITDIKNEYIFDVHLWSFIVMSIVYSLFVKNGIENAFDVFLGLIVAVIAMECLAKLSYYLIRKKDTVTNEVSGENTVEDNETSVQTDVNENIEATETPVCEANNTEEGECENPPVNDTQTDEADEDNENEEDIDINEYVNKYKRAFGEGDTYLAAGSGALLGVEYVLFALIGAIIVQSVCILPQFFFGLYKQKEIRLLISLSLFVFIAVAYWILSNIYTLPLWAVFAFIIPLIYFAIDSITRLKRTVNNKGFIAIPFGPALLLTTFIILFWGDGIISFFKKHIFLVMG